MRKITLIAIILIYCTNFCQVSAQQTVDYTTIRIDPTLATGDMMVDEVVESVDFIPLETNKKSIFGAIQQLVVTSDRFILADQETNNILIFLKNGKFVAKINRLPIERKIFWVDQKSKEIVFIVGNDNFQYFSYEGKRLRQKRISKLGFTENLTFFPDSIIAYSAYMVNDKLFKDTVNHEITLVKNNKVLAEFLPYNMKKEALTLNNLPNQEQGPFFLSGNFNWAYFARPYDYTVYELSVSSLREKYKFVFPNANSFNRKDFNDPVFQADARKYFRVHPQLVSRISHVYKLGDILSFKLNSVGKSFGPFIYNIQTQTLCPFQNIIPGEKSFNLPVNKGKELTGSPDEGIICCDGEYFYSSISSVSFLTQQASNEKSTLKVNYPQTLAQYFKKANKMDNPVIVQIRPKNSF
jgi:6-bladed beta-propeller